MFHDFCQSVTLAFCQKTHVSHDHHPRGQCCSSARISYDAPCMGAISYQKIFASALICYVGGICPPNPLTRMPFLPTASSGASWHDFEKGHEILKRTSVVASW